MFKKYHIVIFKDRDGGFRKVQLRGWILGILLLLLFSLSGLSVFLWTHYDRARALEVELESAKRIAQDYDRQVLRLSGQLQTLQEDLSRVQQFDSKLRVLMNIGDSKDSELPETASAIANLHNPSFLAQHRELYARRTHSLVDELLTQVQLEELDQQTLVCFLRENQDILLSTPSIWPADGYVTSGFGKRRSPFTGIWTMHAGIDVANRVGTPIWAPARGVVTFAENDGAYGLSIVIDHGNNVSTRYAHLSKLGVKPKQVVQRGEVIGSMGNTGRSTGPHLHYEVRIGGMPVDPRRYILN